MLRRIIIGLVFCLALSAGPVHAQVTFDPANKNVGITLSNGNLTAANTAGSDGFISVMVTKSVGPGVKVCAEFVQTTYAATNMQGVGDSSANTASYMGADTHSNGYEDNNAWLDNGASHAGSWNGLAANGDTALVCLDVGNAKTWVKAWTSSACGAWNVGDPATNTSGNALRPSQPIFFGATLWAHGASSITLNPNSGTFKCALPSGFMDLTTATAAAGDGFMDKGCCSN